VPSEQRAKTSVAPTSLTQGRAELLVLLAAVLFSTGGAGIKVSAFSAAQVSAMRSGIAAVALLAWTRRRVPLSWNLLFVGAVYAVTLTLFVAATRLTTAANAIFLQSTAPLYLLALGPLVLKERFGRREVLFVGVIFAGMLICLQDSPPGTLTAPDPATGNLLAALSAVTWAVTLLCFRSIGRQSSSSDLGLSAALVGNALACVFTLPFALPLPFAAAGDWATLVYLGVVQIALAYVCLTAAIRVLPALDVSLLLLIEPVLNPVWTWLVRDEQPGRWTIFGGALILAGTALKAVLDARMPVHRAPVPSDPSSAAAERY
jgi:DME family drug/metabolite transporter